MDYNSIINSRQHISIIYQTFYKTQSFRYPNKNRQSSVQHQVEKSRLQGLSKFSFRFILLTSEKTLRNLLSYQNRQNFLAFAQFILYRVNLKSLRFTRNFNRTSTCLFCSMSYLVLCYHMSMLERYTWYLLCTILIRYSLSLLLSLLL
jgi:hypothetical protein